MRSILVRLLNDRVIFFLGFLLVAFLALFLFELGQGQAASAPSGGDAKNAGGGDAASTSYYQAKKRFQELQVDTAKRQKRHHWERVVNDFEQIATRYPQHPRGIDSRYNVARLYEDLYPYSGKKADLKRALANYKKVWKTYPQSRLADDALYRSGRIHWKNFGDAESARQTLELVLTRYGEGDQRGKAKLLLTELPKPKKTKNQEVALFFSEKIQVDRRPENEARITIPLSRGEIIREQVLTGNGQKRVFFDLQQTQLEGATGKQIPVGHAGLKQIRMSQYRPQTVRVVLDLDSDGFTHFFQLSEPQRLLVDVAKGKPARIAKESSKKEVPLAIEAKRKQPIIVIDPGHGGDDPGAIGRGGTEEKVIALQISRRLQKHLERVVKAKVYLTRNRDVFIPLDERSKFANEKEADLFLSVHCNANHNSKLRGIQTYFLDTIKDNYSRKLAARENAMSIEGMSDLEMILLDLTNRESHERSSRLAGLIQHNLVGKMSKKYRSINDLGVRTAVFLVLFHAEMPAALIETSFLSNRAEEKRLRLPGYQDSVAFSVALGVKDYFDKEDQIVGTL